MAPFRQLEDQGEFILYDPQVIPQMDRDWFDLDLWQDQGCLLGGAPGRGTSQFIQTPVGEVAFRHYQRGGLPGRFIKDCYWWTGLERTRAWQEMKLTRQLLDLKLPVPQPLAARVQRQGCLYRADLMTLRIPEALPLSDWLPQASWQQQQSLLETTALTLRAFHQAGLNHTDLNPRNLLVQPASQKIWLIDFDRCQLGKPSKALAESNLARLYRGLKKVDPQLAPEWFALLKAAYLRA